jgi:hypothetical protein
MEHRDTKDILLNIRDPGGLYAMVSYAVVVTIIAVIVTVYLGRVLGKLGVV